MRRVVLALFLCAAFVSGAVALAPGGSGQSPCPKPGCPVIDCPGFCYQRVCDPGHCRQHCVPIPDCA